MPQVQLSAIASARSGDKGEGSNVGLIAHSEAAYAFLRDALTEDVVRAHFAGINHGGVTRFAADNMRVLHFLLEVHGLYLHMVAHVGGPTHMRSASGDADLL